MGPSQLALVPTSPHPLHTHISSHLHPILHPYGHFFRMNGRGHVGRLEEPAADQRFCTQPLLPARPIRKPSPPSGVSLEPAAPKPVRDIDCYVQASLPVLPCHVESCAVVVGDGRLSRVKVSSLAAQRCSADERCITNCGAENHLASSLGRRTRESDREGHVDRKS